MATPLADLLTQVTTLKVATDNLKALLSERTDLQARAAQLQVDIPLARQAVATAKADLQTLLTTLESL